MAGGKSKKSRNSSKKKKKHGGKKKPAQEGEQASTMPQAVPQTLPQAATSTNPQSVPLDEILAHPARGTRLPEATTYHCLRFDFEARDYVRCSPTDKPIYHHVWAKKEMTMLEVASAAAHAEIATRSRTLVDGVFDHWDALKDLITQSGDLISARWAAMSGDERQNHMQDAWPMVPTRSYPDVALRYAGKSGSGTRSDFGENDLRARNRAGYLLPRCNTVEFCALNNILEAIQPRVDQTPSEFALQDLANMQVGLAIDGVDKADVEGALCDVFILVDGPSLGRDKYGTVWTRNHMIAHKASQELRLQKLYEDETRDSAASTCVPRSIWTAQPALLVLEAQHALYGFMLNLCNKIVASSNGAVATGLPQIASTSPIAPSSGTPTPSMPTLFGLESVALSMVADRLAEGQARIRTMREDPKYTQQLLSAHVRHSMQISNRDLLTHTDNLDEVKSVMVNGIMREAYIEQSLWQGLYLYMRLINGAYQDFVINERIAPQHMPEDVYPPILRMVNCLNALRIRLSKHMSTVSTDGFRPWEPVVHDLSEEAPSLENEDLWLDNMLSCFADLGFVTAFGIHNVFEFIEIQSHRDGKKQSSPWHASRFEDMGIIACVFRELHWFDLRRWDGVVMRDFVNPKAPLEAGEYVMPVWKLSAPYITCFEETTATASLGGSSIQPSWMKNFPDESIAFFCSKIRYRQNLQLPKHIKQRITANDHLDKLWGGFEECIANFDINDGLEDVQGKAWPSKLTSDHPLKDYFTLILPSSEDVHRPEMPAFDDVKQNKGKGKMISDGALSIGAPHTAFAITAGADTPGKFELALHPKIRTKTRPDVRDDLVDEALLNELPGGDVFAAPDNEAQPELGQDEEEGGEDDEDENEVVVRADPSTDASIALPQRHLFTMRCMFGAEKQKLVKWAAFKKALAHMNFEIMKQHGSIWRIAPPQTISDHGISIHYHEEATIEPYKRHEFAYRMRHSFGWGATTFVLG